MDVSKAYYYIPIIGTISAGKSTFLKALLGIDFLEVGELTTTRFICLIKNSKETKFYHVIPKKGEEIYYEKDGEEINKEEEITKKIEEVNKALSDKKKNTNDIFYMLEVPFKHIDNELLLEKCYFMDIPGLNEDFNFYIEKISSLINQEDDYVLNNEKEFAQCINASEDMINCIEELGNKWRINHLGKNITSIELPIKNDVNFA